jgi:hypothetical protein
MVHSLSGITLAQEGRLDEAMALNDEVLALGSSSDEPDAQVWWAAGLFAIRLVAGTAGELADLAGQLADSMRTLVWRTAHAFALAESGREAEARDIVRRYQLDPVALLDEPWPGVPQVQLAHVAFRLRDEDLARRCIEALEPYRHLIVHWFLGMYGPATLGLGFARSAAGDHAGAVAEFEDALRTCDAAGFAGIAVLVRASLGEAHARAGDPRADAVLRHALDDARAIGASGIEARVSALLT